MSGRDVEPVAAFFPSIDRNLMRDLDRQLRSAQPPAAPEPGKARQAARPNIDDVVEAVALAGSSINDMASRIQELEAQVFGLEGANSQLQKQVADAVRLRETAEAAVRGAAEKTAAAERAAVTHVARAEALERELTAALADLNRLTDAISNALGLPDDQVA